MQVYYDKDADLSLIQGKKVAIILSGGNMTVDGLRRVMGQSSRV